MTPEEINDKRFQRLEMDIAALRTDVNILLTQLGLPSRSPRRCLTSASTIPAVPSVPLMSVVQTG